MRNVHSLRGGRLVDADRRPIQIDDPAVQAGIAAALRRAFVAAEKQREPDDFSFEELLKQLH